MQEAFSTTKNQYKKPVFFKKKLPTFFRKFLDFCVEIFFGEHLPVEQQRWCPKWQNVYSEHVK